jgi:Fur family ferric uptake transcriptional regulator
MTIARQTVLETLDAALWPLSAAEIVSRVHSLCDQATVYRALHYLEAHEKIESFVLHCKSHGTERYFVSRLRPHRHWFHCQQCHCFIDLGECQLGKLVTALEQEKQVTITGHSLYFTGLCQACAEFSAP